MANVLITGCRGFIGSHLSNYLKDIHKLVCINSDILNLLDQSAVKNFIIQHHIDLIIHCASAGIPLGGTSKGEDIIQINLKMFRNLSGFCPLFILGSGAEYDKRQNLHKIREQDFGKSIPIDPYGLSKYLISKEIEQVDNTFNLRLFGVYGPKEHENRLTSYVLKKSMEGTPIFLKQNVLFDFIWIQDLCEIIGYFIKKLPTHKFLNITPTQSIEILQLAKMANNITGNESEIRIQNEGFNNEYTACNKLMMSELHKYDFTSYSKGMYQLYESLRSI